MRSESVREVITLRRNAAAREGTVSVNADPLEYEMLTLCFQTVREQLIDDGAALRTASGPVEIISVSLVKPQSLRDLRAYTFAVLCMGTLSRFRELAERKFGDLQPINEDLLYLDFDSGTKTTKNRVHRTIQPWEGLDDHRIDPPSIYRLWVGVREGESRESEYIFPHIKNENELCVSIPMDEGEWTKDIRKLLLRSAVKKAFVERISTHSCRRGGVQLMLDLGYTMSTVMEIGGWDSVEAFWCYTRPCNRRKSRFTARNLLRAQLIDMQNANFQIRRVLKEVSGASMRNANDLVIWPEASHSSCFSEREQSRRMERRTEREPFITAISRGINGGISDEVRLKNFTEGRSCCHTLVGLERKVDRLLALSRSFDECTIGSKDVPSSKSNRTENRLIHTRVIPPASSFESVLADWEVGRDGSEPLKSIWKRRKSLSRREKELLRKRVDVVLCYYDIRRERGEIAWEKEIGRDESGKKRRIGEIVSYSRRYFTNDTHKKRKKQMLRELAQH